MAESDIDKAILTVVGANGRPMKVAMVLVQVMTQIDGKLGSDERCQEIARRIGLLVAESKIMGYGNLQRWRHSEVGPIPSAQ